MARNKTETRRYKAEYAMALKLPIARYLPHNYQSQFTYKGAPIINLATKLHLISYKRLFIPEKIMYNSSLEVSIMDNSPIEILQETIKKGIKKANATCMQTMMLSLLGGTYISLGYLGYVRISATLEPYAVGHLLGSMMFPVGLIMILMGGGELLTGNIVDLSVAFFAKKIKLSQVLRNWFLVALFNAIGSIALAYFFGHFLGLTEGHYLERTVAIATSKTNADFITAFVSGIGCNILVGISVWMATGGKTFASKVPVIWFPVTLFVLLGFQHSVANMFIIPAAIFAGHLNWMLFVANFIPVVLGNIVGGGIVVGWSYVTIYSQK